MLRVKNPLHAKVIQHVRRNVTRKRLLVGGSVVISIFILSNIIVSLAYRQRMFPNSYIDLVPVGNKTYRAVERLDLVPKEVTFKAGTVTKKMSTNDLGALENWPETKRQVGLKKPLLSVVGLFGRKQYSLAVDYNIDKKKKVVEQLSKDFTLESRDAAIDISGNEAKLVPSKEGQAVTTEDITVKLYQGITGGTITVPTEKVAPKISNKDIEATIKELNAKRQVTLSYAYDGSTKSPSQHDILTWYDITGTTISLNKDRVAAYLTDLGMGLGIRIQNKTQLTTDTVNALTRQTKLVVGITAAPKAIKQYTFCVRGKNVNEDELPNFAAKILSVLNDSRGWSLDGKVSFSQGTSGCNMIAWLSAANDMSSFGAICDSLWSCTVKPNVIINHDRWVGASDAWNAQDGSLDDYRSMVINHESGHWFGFNHRFCGGAGQAAPVMQQQSISLQGCTFNPWPTTAEKDSLKSMLGL